MGTAWLFDYDVLGHYNTFRLLNCLFVGKIGTLNSCVHICHARDKNIETITVGFTGLEKLHEYILSGLNSQLNDHMT